MVKELKPKKVKGRIAVLMAAPYKGSMMYLRKIGEEIFEYLVIFKNELYTNYMIFTLPKGKKKMTNGQNNAARNLILAGGQATVDMLLGDKMKPEDKMLAKDFEQVSKNLPN